jgi:hypothetical protein
MSLAVYWAKKCSVQITGLLFVPNPICRSSLLSALLPVLKISVVVALQVATILEDIVLFLIHHLHLVPHLGCSILWL